jgi:hypothetical protein
MLMKIHVAGFNLTYTKPGTFGGFFFKVFVGLNRWPEFIGQRVAKAL